MTRKKHKKEEVTDEQILDPTAGDTATFSDKNVVNDEKKDEENKTEEKIEVNPVEQIQAQLDEMKDKYIRLSAEFDNYRKRSLREKMDLTKYASEDILQSILPLYDDFERAMKSWDESTDIDAVKQGLHLIYNKFYDFLKTKGISEIEAIGKELNTDIHEAITKIPAQDDAMKGKIVDVVQKGYMLNDKVIRFSKVVIGE
ncbi:MAG: nucleotide exchange factor GrpE [Bacteroidales bacterium]|nr:nucleotide exchange factor GrpE [Bacteroidales bacterium]